MKKIILYVFAATVLFFLFSTNSSAQKKRIRKTAPAAQILVFSAPNNNCSPVAGLAVVTITKTNDFILGINKIEKDSLVKELNRYVCNKLPPDQIIYVKAQEQTPYSQVIQALKAGRKNDIDTFGLSLADEKKSNIESSSVIIKVPAEEENPSSKKVKALPLVLDVSLEANGNLKLNSKTETLETLTKKLKQIFLTRKQKRIYRKGTNDIETTIFVYAKGDVKFADVFNVVRIIKSTGGDPIGLDVDDYYLKVIF